MQATISKVTLCGAIRPSDGTTRCNRAAGHDHEHMLLGPEVRGARPGYATWDQDGTEVCDHCGHRMVNGMCSAPLSVAD